MWKVRIEEDENDGFVECVFIVNTETGQRDRQEGLGWYLDELRQEPDFDEAALIEIYIREAEELAASWNATGRPAYLNF